MPALNFMHGRMVWTGRYSTSESDGFIVCISGIPVLLFQGLGFRIR